MTKAEMQRAAEVAQAQGYFRYLKPISQQRLDAGDGDWPPCLPEGTWV